MKTNWVNILKTLFTSPYPYWSDCHCDGCDTNQSGWESQEYKKQYGCERRLIYDNQE